MPDLKTQSFTIMEEEKKWIDEDAVPEANKKEQQNATEVEQQKEKPEDEDEAKTEKEEIGDEEEDASAAEKEDETKVEDEEQNEGEEELEKDEEKEHKVQEDEDDKEEGEEDGLENQVLELSNSDFHKKDGSSQPSHGKQLRQGKHVKQKVEERRRVGTGRIFSGSSGGGAGHHSRPTLAHRDNTWTCPILPAVMCKTSRALINVGPIRWEPKFKLMKEASPILGLQLPLVKQETMMEEGRRRWQRRMVGKEGVMIEEGSFFLLILPLLFVETEVKTLWLALL